MAFKEIRVSHSLLKNDMEIFFVTQICRRSEFREWAVQGIKTMLRRRRVSRGSAVGIATTYGLDDREVGVRVPIWSEFSLFRIVQTGSGAHPAPIQWFPGGKTAGA
jgi:hypothetical protein